MLEPSTLWLVYSGVYLFGAILTGFFRECVNGPQWMAGLLWVFCEEVER